LGFFAVGLFIFGFLFDLTGLGNFKSINPKARPASSLLNLLFGVPTR
jgi:uncharacterized membrane protein